MRVPDSTARTRQEEDRHVGDVEEARAVEVEMAVGGEDNLRGMTRESEVAAKGDELGMPDGEEHVAARGAGAGEHGVSGDARESFIQEMQVEGPAAEGRWIVV